MAGGKPHVLVTRPPPGAERTAEALRQRGCTPLLLPLTETAAVAPSAALPSHVEAVAVSSANALRHAGAGLLTRLAGVPTYAVGEETAHAARRAGLSVAWTGNAGAAAMALALRAALDPPATVLYLAGSVRLAGLEDRLRDHGLQVAVVETYATRDIAYTRTELDARLGAEPIAALLLYSAVAAERLGALPLGQEHRSMLRRARCLCLSSRIAQKVPAGMFRSVEVSASPDERALLSLLDPGGGD